MRIPRRSRRILLAAVFLWLFALGLQLLLAQYSPAAAGVGPKRGIKCPPEAVRVGPRARIQAVINGHPPGTAFCLRPGVYRRKRPITPKSRSRFIGEYGAIIDGSRWMTRDRNQGLFRAHNQNVDGVVIRNLIIRGSPQRGIHAYKDHSDGWIIEHNLIQGNRVGIAHGNSFLIRRNLIRRNWQYGITSYRSSGSLIRNNEIRFNAGRFRELPGDAAASKWAQVTNTVVRGNRVLDNYHTGIWFDGGHSGIVIEGNTVRGNGGNGILTEVGGSTIVRNNTVSGHHRGIYVSESHETNITGNLLIGNDRAVWLFQDGSRRAEGELEDSLITANSIRVPSSPVVAGVVPLATGLNCVNLTPAECAAYSTDRGNVFQGNAYTVPSPGRWWRWENTLMTWTEWRAAGQDTTGSLKVG